MDSKKADFLTPFLKGLGQRVEINGQEYFPVVHLISAITGSEYREAKILWAIFKHKVQKSLLKRHAYILQYVESIQILNMDGRVDEVDAITSKGFELFNRLYLMRDTAKRKRRIANGGDEVENFQPFVKMLLSYQGWVIEQNFRLTSGKIVDLLAVRNEENLLIECKVNVSSGGFYSAVGQVLCYCTEYMSVARPAIAIPVDQVDDYMRVSCNNLGIELIEVDYSPFTPNSDLISEYVYRGVIDLYQISALYRELSKAVFGITPAEHRRIKHLRYHDLRKHFTALEIALWNVGEESIIDLIRMMDAQGFNECKTAAQQGGRVAGDARRNLESLTGKKVVSSENYLENSQDKTKRLKKKNS